MFRASRRCIQHASVELLRVVVHFTSPDLDDPASVVARKLVRGPFLALRLSVLPIERVTAFVDWNSQIHAQPKSMRGAPDLEVTRQTLSYVARTVARSLAVAADDRRFDVVLRVYHGWRKGFEETARRKALVSVVASADFHSLSPRTNVSIRPDIEFGDQLLSGRSVRYHAKIKCHLPNTLRRRENDGASWEEKMVDTAIASDVVDTAHREPRRWIVLVGDDDDLIPPAYVAEGIRNNTDGKIILIRDRPDTPFFNLAGIGYRP